MKIAIPVKTNRENPAISPLFGKAKWFAFVEDGKVSIEKSPIPDGRAVIEWFLKSGVDTIVMQEMGNGPYNMIKSHGGIKVYHAGFDRITLDEVLEKFNNGTMSALDDAAMQSILAHHESKHTHGHDHHGEGHGHHHHH